jgi:IS66 Orf2 like protein
MITLPAGARILLATRPVDFRKGAHGLAALAQEALAEDPFSGAVIVYRSKGGDRLKILVWDHSGGPRSARLPSGGSLRDGAGLEAAAAGIVPLATDQGRGPDTLTRGLRRVI